MANKKGNIFSLIGQIIVLSLSSVFLTIRFFILTTHRFVIKQENKALKKKVKKTENLSEDTNI